MTKHLTPTDVADFVRNVAAPAPRRRIERHLASGCVRCRKSVDLFRGINATARDDGRWEPPAAVLERADEIFAIAPRRVEPLTRRLLARIVFDSIRQPLPAGVRASNSVTRHVLYRAGDFFIDLRVDAEHGARRVSIVGQVANRRAPRAVALETVSVLLTDRTTILTRASVNPFGEFHLDCDVHAQLRLRVLFGEQTGLDVPLARLLKPASNDENARRST